MPKRITVVQESGTCRNEKFRDSQTGTVMSRPELVRKIESGQYPNYHTSKINNLKTPVSNPDSFKKNNLD